LRAVVQLVSVHDHDYDPILLVAYFVLAARAWGQPHAADVRQVISGKWLAVLKAHPQLSQWATPLHGARGLLKKLDPVPPPAFYDMFGVHEMLEQVFEFMGAMERNFQMAAPLHELVNLCEERQALLLNAARRRVCDVCQQIRRRLKACGGCRKRRYCSRRGLAHGEGKARWDVQGDEGAC